MRSPLSQRKKQLIVRIAASRLEMLDSSLRLSHDVTSLPSRLADRGKGMLKLAAVKVKGAAPKTAARTSAHSKHASKLQLALIAALSAVATYLAWRFTHLRIGQLFCRAMGLIFSCLKDAWRKLVWPLLSNSLKSCWKTLVSK